MSERKHGLMLIVGGAAVGAALFVALIALSKLGVIQPTVSVEVHNGYTVEKTKYSAIWGLPIVVPLFSTLIGVIKLITGRTFGQLALAYQDMSGALRFVVSVLIVALALAVIGGLIAIAFAIMLP